MKEKKLIKKNPYYIFTNENKSHPRRKIKINFIHKMENNKKININLFKECKSHNLKVLSTTKSLNEVILNSNSYRSYIDLYTKLTQENSFKNPSFDKYPLVKNKDYLSVKLHNLTEKIPNDSIKKENFSLSKSNTVFLSHLKSIKTPNSNRQKLKYALFYSNEFFNDKNSKDDSANDWKDFYELCYENLFESKFLKKNKIKKIDIDNCFIEKQKNFKFFLDYIKKAIELKDIFSENNYHRNITFSGRTLNKKENIEFSLDIYSLCFKFFSLNNKDNNNNENKKVQKLYFPFILMPFFYSLDFTSFKVLLSEIIIYNKDKGFEYIKEKLLIQTLKKYISYIENSIKNKNNYINDITYNKNEKIFNLIYDWIITWDYLKEEEIKENSENNLENNNNYKCFKLKIILPKIKFNVDNLKIKINKLLQKQIIANILKNKFKK